MIVLILAAFAACNMPECKNTNPVFDNYAMRTNEYKTELAKQLRMRNPDEIRYWIGYYHAVHGREYASVYTQANGLCAMMFLDISDGEGWKQFKEAKGGGYSGAEIKGMQYHVRQSITGPEFIFDSMDYIFD
jgi:hypothetical protein